jgi:hypothetical protein
MPYLIENDIHRRTHIEGYEPPIDGGTQARISLGIALRDEEQAALPKRVLVPRPPSATKTFIYAMNVGPYVMPPVAHRLIMQLEPGLHSFHELEAVCDGESLGPYFLLLQTPEIDCIDLDNTIFTRGGGREYYEEVMARPTGPGGGAPRISIHAAQRIGVIAAAIAGRHLWRTPRSFSSELLCSGELREGLQEAKVAGLRYTRCYTPKKKARG